MAMSLNRRVVIAAGLVFWLLTLATAVWMVLLQRGVGQRLELLEGQFQVETMAHTAQMNDLETRLHQLEAATPPKSVAAPAPKNDQPKPRPLRRLLGRLKGKHQ